MIDIAFLKNVEVLKGLDNDQLALIKKCCSEKKYWYGDRLFREGEDATSLKIVKKGRVDLRFDLPSRFAEEENTLYSISEKMAFAWSSLVSPYKYRLSAYCTTNTCDIVQLDKESLLKLFEEEPGIGFVVMSNLIAVIGQRFQRLQDTTIAAPLAGVKITVHLATCGIIAGAREVMTALMEEIVKSNRQGIEVISSGCLGMCNTEPNVTVEIGGEEPVIYQKMNPDKMRRVFKEHILKDNIQTDLVLAKDKTK